MENLKLVKIKDKDLILKGISFDNEHTCYNNYNNIEDVLIGLITSATNYGIYYKDELTGNIDNAFSLYRKNELNDNIDCTFFLATEPLIIALCILTTYLSKTAVCFSLELIKEGILNKYQFPFSLMSNLKKINMDIDSNKEEEKKMSLSLNK